MKKITYLLAILVSMISGLQCSSDNIEGHDYVDLGLPSGIKWATCNVGTNKPTKLGNYFAWAEVNKTEGFVIADNKYLKVGSNTRYSKYVITQEEGSDIDNLATLLPFDDAATQNWGSHWRTPTELEYREMLKGCTWSWVDSYKGSKMGGYLGKSRSNDKEIFFPATGFDGEKSNTHQGGAYWTSSVCPDTENAFAFLLNKDGGFFLSKENRTRTYPIRAIYDKEVKELDYYKKRHDSHAKNNSDNENSKEEVCIKVEEKAAYPGGEKAIKEFLDSHLSISGGGNIHKGRSLDKTQENKTCRVLLKLLIEKDGTISDVQVLRSASEEMDAEAIRVVKLMQGWTPGKIHNKPVRSYYTLPVGFN